MARQIDLDAAKALLEEVFVEAVADFAASIAPTVSGEVETATERLMRAKDQGHREAAVGCAIARILDPEIDLHLPYVNLGEFAYHARDLDEQVVNPFFQN